MKRKLDKQKIYALIGRVVVYTTAWAITVSAIIWGFCQNTIY